MATVPLRSMLTPAKSSMFSVWSRDFLTSSMVAELPEATAASISADLTCALPSSSFQLIGASLDPRTSIGSASGRMNFAPKWASGSVMRCIGRPRRLESPSMMARAPLRPDKKPSKRRAPVPELPTLIFALSQESLRVVGENYRLVPQGFWRGRLQLASHR